MLELIEWKRKKNKAINTCRESKCDGEQKLEHILMHCTFRNSENDY